MGVRKRITVSTSKAKYTTTTTIIKNHIIRHHLPISLQIGVFGILSQIQGCFGTIREHYNNHDNVLTFVELKARQVVFLFGLQKHLNEKFQQTRRHIRGGEQINVHSYPF